ncbi:MAG: antibiotic biosynthesis monooxygenase [Candidatus Kariarchaeaceae archaeon]
MIVRVGHDIVPKEKSKLYNEFLIERAVPDYSSIDGNLSVKILRRDEEEVTHFLTITTWKSYEVIKKFAGENIDQAKYYPEDKEFLIEFEPNVIHYEVTCPQP